MSSTDGAGPKPVARPGKTSSSKFVEADALYAGKLDSMTMKEKALLGLPYLASDPNMVHERTRTRNLLREYNSSASGPASPDEEGANDLTNAKRRELLGKLFQVSPETAKRLFVEPPFWW